MRLRHMQLNLAARGVERTVESLKTQYVNPYREPVPRKPTSHQIMELSGEVCFDKGLYHNREYELLIMSLKESREKYLAENNIEERKAISKTQLSLWNEYVKTRFSQIPEELEFTEKMRSNIFQVYQNYKDRYTGLLMPNQIINMHHEYASLFKFNPVIDTQYMEQMIYPSRAYLCYFESGLTYEELMAMYECMIVATYEKLVGQDLLGHEISSLAFWNQYDKNKDGYLSIQSFLNLLKAFRFANIKNTEDLKKEFGNVFSTIDKKSNRELLDIQGETIRFEVLKKIFLQRNL